MANEKRLISVCDATSVYNGIALYMAENAYLNDTALDVLKMVAKWLNECPTVDAVPVVRCKDCKFSSEDGGYDSIEQMKTHLNCRRIHRGFIGCAIVPKEGFCSYGERKDNG